MRYINAGGKIADLSEVDGKWVVRLNSGASAVYPDAKQARKLLLSLGYKQEGAEDLPDSGVFAPQVIAGDEKEWRTIANETRQN